MMSMTSSGTTRVRLRLRSWQTSKGVSKKHRLNLIIVELRRLDVRPPLTTDAVGRIDDSQPTLEGRAAALNLGRGC